MKTREFWKVCKKLANEERLDVLRHVILSPADEGITVGQIADVVRLGQPATSIYLAQLQNDCGLVSSSREGRYCLYRAKPDS
jgi:DNA-binding transcriptional ArsR family regulator